MPFPETARVCGGTSTRCDGAGSSRSSDAASVHSCAGRNLSASPTVSSRRSGYHTHCHVTASTPEPEGRARCVSSARRDLCGGRLVTAVPTVTIECAAQQPVGRLSCVWQALLDIRDARQEDGLVLVPRISAENIFVPV